MCRSVARKAWERERERRVSRLKATSCMFCGLNTVLCYNTAFMLSSINGAGATRRAFLNLIVVLWSDRRTVFLFCLFVFLSFGDLEGDL